MIEPPCGVDETEGVLCPSQYMHYRTSDSLKPDEERGRFQGLSGEASAHSVDPVNTPKPPA